MSNDCSDLMLFSIFLGLKPRSHCVPRRTWTYVDVHCTLTYGDVVIEQVDFYTVAFTHTLRLRTSTCLLDLCGMLRCIAVRRKCAQ